MKDNIAYPFYEFMIESGVVYYLIGLIWQWIAVQKKTFHRKSLYGKRTAEKHVVLK
jgi:hypothetical protein